MAGLSNAEEEELVRTGPGTPSGAVFRRYWIPVEVTENLEVGDKYDSGNGPKNPIRVRVLGEELVLWRDADGVAHLMDEHCAHRGTSLYYGRVEEHCIRCPYHAWAYDGTGQCVDQPAEPPTSRFKDGIRQTTYPTYEVAGVIFAYLGPPELEPEFPRYDVLFREDGLRITGDANYVQRCNVFQAMHDNNLDSWHPEYAHNWWREGPPQVNMHHGRDGRPPTPVRYDRTPWGTRDVVLKDTKDEGRYEYYELHTVWPSARCNRDALRWAIPVDDYNTRWFVVEFYGYGPDGKLSELSERNIARQMNGEVANMTLSERFPDDWADQVGAWWNFEHPWRQGVLWEDEVICGTQGPAGRNGLPNWEKWNLASSDRGVLLNRRLWREQMDRVAEGLDPIGIIREPQDELIVIPAGRLNVDWGEGMALFDLSPEERLAAMKAAGLASGANTSAPTTDALRK